jgi:hypothetical protein
MMSLFIHHNLTVTVASFCGATVQNNCTMRRGIRRQCYYDAHVNDVNLEEITSSENNANILRALHDGYPHGDLEKSGIQVFTEDYEGLLIVDDDHEKDFVIREGDDLGWLGYFIGASKCLEALSIRDLPVERERIDAFMEGLARNKSIQEVGFLTDIGEAGVLTLGDFFKSNKNLSMIGFGHNNFGQEEHSHDNICFALGQIQRNSIEMFCFFGNIISDEGFSEICGALVTQQSRLERLGFRETLGFGGQQRCVTVGNMLSSWRTPNLRELQLDNNEIDDTGLQPLVTGMMNCRDLRVLHISGNNLITAAGLRSLSPLFDSLEELRLEQMYIGDCGAVALADGLKGNKALKFLFVDPNTADITDIGWVAFSNMLCDTSSFNSTYLSNHTLVSVGDSDFSGTYTPDYLQKRSSGNPLRNKQDVAIWKIMRFHPIHNMSEFFFPWKLKFLPLVVTWFKRARHVLVEMDALAGLNLPPCFEYLETIKLSAVYKYVRGMPLLTVDGYNSRRTSTRLARKRRLNGETK